MPSLPCHHLVKDSSALSNSLKYQRTVHLLMVDKEKGLKNEFMGLSEWSGDLRFPM